MVCTTDFIKEKAQQCTHSNTTKTTLPNSVHHTVGQSQYCGSYVRPCLTRVECFTCLFIEMYVKNNFIFVTLFVQWMSSRCG